VFGGFPLVKIVAVFAVLAYLAAKLGRGEGLSVVTLELKMLGAITLLGALFAPLAAAPQDSIDVLLDLFIKVAIIFVLMINVITTRERLYSMLNLVVICGTIFALLAIKSYLIGDFKVVQNTEGSVVALRINATVGGIFGNPNDLATTFDMLLPLAVALALTSSGLKRVAYFICAIILTAGVVVTFSRGGFLGRTAMAGVLVGMLSHQRRAITALAFSILLGVFVLAMPTGYTDRISSIFHLGQDQTGSSQARHDLLDRAIDVAVHHPIVGIGMGNFHIYSIHEQVAHNSYVEIAAELGLAGLVAYLVLIFAPLRSLRRIERETAGPEQKASVRIRPVNPNQATHFLSIAIQAMLFAYVVCSFFGSVEYQWFLYYPVAYAVALRRIYASERATSSAEVNQAPVETESIRRRALLWRPYHSEATQAPASSPR